MRNAWYLLLLSFVSLLSKLHKQIHTRNTKNLRQRTTWPSIKRKLLKSAKKIDTLHTEDKGKMRLDFSPEAEFSPQVILTSQYAEVKNTLYFCVILTHTIQTEVNRKGPQTGLKWKPTKRLGIILPTCLERKETSLYCLGGRTSKWHESHMHWEFWEWTLNQKR